MLNFLSGVPSGEVEAHTKMGHAGIGLAWPFAPRWTAYIEDRFEFSLPDIVPIGELNAGGNVLMIGLGFNMAPEAQIAPH